MPFEQIAPEKVCTTLNVESGDWGRTWTLVFFYEAQLSTVQPFCSNANESVAFQYLVRLLVKEIEGKTNIACNLRGNYSLTTENDRSSFENLLLPGEIGLPSISFLHELFITQLQIQDVAAKSVVPRLLLLYLLSSHIFHILQLHFLPFFIILYSHLSPYDIISRLSFY